MDFFKPKPVLFAALIVAMLVLSACLALPTQSGVGGQDTHSETAADENAGELIYYGPAEMGSPDASKCATLQLGASAQAILGACDGATSQVEIGERTELEWTHFRDRFAPFVYETATEKLVFAGRGNATSEPWQRAILAWARARHAEFATGRTSASIEPVITWHREGGFAGFCDDIAVYANGDVTVRTCAGNQSTDVAHIRLAADQLTMLTDWLARLQPFKVEQKDPAVADAMTIRVLFAGTGNAAATESDQAAIADFAQSLLNGLGESPTGLGGTDYANALGGFSMQYPAAAVRYEDARLSVDGALVQMLNTVALVNSDPNFVLTITWFDQQEGATLRSFIDANSECADTTAIGGQPFPIDGQEALVYPNTPCGPYGATYLFTLVASRGYRFTIENMTSYDDIRGDVEAILNSWRFEPYHAAQFAPALCPQPTETTRLLIDGANRFCLLYPINYTAAHLPDGAIELVTQSLMNHTDPRVSMSVADAAGRTLEQVATEWESLYAHQGFNIERGATTVDGVDAVMFDNLPGQDLNRRLVLVRNGRIYSFFFTPLGDDSTARAKMEAFYQGILDAFRFLDETVAEPLPRPEAAI